MAKETGSENTKRRPALKYERKKRRKTLETSKIQGQGAADGGKDGEETAKVLGDERSETLTNRDGIVEDKEAVEGMVKKMLMKDTRLLTVHK